MIPLVKDQLKKVHHLLSIKHQQFRREILKFVDFLQQLKGPLFPYQGLFTLILAAANTHSKKVINLFAELIHSIFLNDLGEQQLASKALQFFIACRKHKKYELNQALHSKEQQIVNFIVSKDHFKVNDRPLYQAILIFLLTSSMAMVDLVISSLTLLFVKAYRQQKIQANQLLADLALLADGLRPSWFNQQISVTLSAACLSGLLWLNQTQVMIEQYSLMKQSLIGILQICYKLYSNLAQTYAENEFIRVLSLLRIISKSIVLLQHDFNCSLSIIANIKHPHSKLRFLSHKTLSYLLKQRSYVKGAIHQYCQNQLNSRISLLLDTFQQLKPFQYSCQITFDSFRDCQAREQRKQLTVLPLVCNCLQLLQSVQQLLEKQVSGAGLKRVSVSFFEKIYNMVRDCIRKDYQENIIQKLAIISQRMIVIFSHFAEHKMSLKFVKLICKESQPPKAGLITSKQLHIHKALLNIIICIGHLLNFQSWQVVWASLDSYQFYYQQYLLNKEYQSPQKLVQIQILTHLKNSIFQQTNSYSLKQVVLIIDSLFHSAYDSIEVKSDKSVFALPCEQKIIFSNLERADLLWDSVFNGILCIASSKHKKYREQAVETLCNLVQQLLKQSKIKQSALIQPLKSILCCKYQELKLLILNFTKKLIVDLGHVLEEGWNLILELLLEGSQEPQNIKRVFQSCQIIVENYIGLMQPHLVQTMIQILCQVITHSHQHNVRYGCLAKLWAICDKIIKYQSSQKHRIMGLIINQLSDPAWMAIISYQQSSFHILTEVLIHNCVDLDCSFWLKVLEQIRVQTDNFIATITSIGDHKSMQQGAKSIVSCMNKIIKKFISTFNEHHQQVLDQYLKFNSAMLVLDIQQLKILIVKSIRELVLVSQIIITFPGFRQIMQYLNDCYKCQISDFRKLKFLLTYLPKSLVDMIVKAFQSGYVQAPQLYFSVLSLYRRCNQRLQLSNNRVYIQEKTFSVFFKDMVTAISRTRPHYAGLFLQKITLQLSDSTLDPLFVKNIPHIFLLFQEKSAFQPTFSHCITICLQKKGSQPNSQLMKKKQMQIWNIALNQILKLNQGRASKEWIIRKLVFFLRVKSVQINLQHSRCIAECELMALKFIGQQFTSASLDQQTTSQIRDLFIAVSKKMFLIDTQYSLETTQVLTRLFASSLQTPSIGMPLQLFLERFLIAVEHNEDKELLLLLDSLLEINMQPLKPQDLDNKLAALLGQRVKLLKKRNGLLPSLVVPLSQLVGSASSPVRQKLELVWKRVGEIYMQWVD